MTVEEMEYVRKHLNEIVEKAKEGDEEAFEQLMGLVETRAKNRVKYKLGEKFVDEVVQEARIAAFQGLKNLQDNMKFESWFFAILNFKIIDAIRKKTTRKKVPVLISWKKIWEINVVKCF